MQLVVEFLGKFDKYKFNVSRKVGGELVTTVSTIVELEIQLSRYHSV